ncbi:MAG: hypothetical protein RIS26_38 [Actinomycetota bacterium]|jgi:hypothetical protein
MVWKALELSSIHPLHSAAGQHVFPSQQVRKMTPGKILSAKFVSNSKEIELKNA